MLYIIRICYKNRLLIHKTYHEYIYMLVSINNISSSFSSTIFWHVLIESTKRSNSCD